MFPIVAAQVVKLFLFIMVGFTLVRTKILPDNAAQTLSKVVLWVFYPAMQLRNFWLHFNVEQLTESVSLLALGTAVIAALVLIGRLTGHIFTKDPYSRDVCNYSVVVPNTAYMGNVLLLELMGEEALLRFQIFNIPSTIYTFSIGYAMLMQKKENLLKGLLNPPFVSMLIGAALGLLRVPLPAVADEILSVATDCVGPCSMLMAGCTIAAFSVREILKNKTVYPVVLVRMLLLPLLGYGANCLLGLPVNLYTVMMIYLILPAGMNTIMFPASVRKDCRLGAGIVCVSHSLSLILIPLMMALLL